MLNFGWKEKGSTERTIVRNKHGERFAILIYGKDVQVERVQRPQGRNKFGILEKQ